MLYMLGAANIQTTPHEPPTFVTRGAAPFVLVRAHFRWPIRWGQKSKLFAISCRDR